MSDLYTCQGGCGQQFDKTILYICTQSHEAVYNQADYAVGPLCARCYDAHCAAHSVIDENHTGAFLQ